MPKYVSIADHLSVDDLAHRYRKVTDPIIPAIFKSSGCWLGENASERLQRALATVPTGFEFWLIATIRMGHGHLPISACTIQALPRFSLRSNKVHCNKPLNKALRIEDCGLVPKWPSGWVSRPGETFILSAAGMISNRWAFLYTLPVLDIARQIGRSKNPFSTNCQSRYNRSGRHIPKPRSNSGAWMSIASDWSLLSDASGRGIRAPPGHSSTTTL